MTMIDTADSRFAKAVQLADRAGSWLKCHTRDGPKRYGIPSSKGDGRFYLVTQSACDCQDQRRHTTIACKHRVAVAVHCARVAGKPMPASDTVDGLAAMVVDRQGPVLDMIREEDGSIRWERHDHANGSVTYLPRHTPTAADNDRVIGRFYDETPEQIMRRL